MFSQFYDNLETIMVKIENEKHDLKIKFYEEMKKAFEINPEYMSLLNIFKQNGLGEEESMVLLAQLVKNSTYDSLFSTDKED